MKKIIIAGAASLFMVAGSAQAISMNGTVGEHYTTLGVGMGTSSSGLGLSGEWARSDHNGDTASVGVQYGLPLGSINVRVGAKGLYLMPESGKSGGALALGGGLTVPVMKNITLYGDVYGAPDGMTSGVKSYMEWNAGVNWVVFSPLSVNLGYRYIEMEGKNGYRNNTLADGVYLGVAANF